MNIYGLDIMRINFLKKVQSRLSQNCVYLEDFPNVCPIFSTTRDQIVTFGLDFMKLNILKKEN